VLSRETLPTLIHEGDWQWDKALAGGGRDWLQTVLAGAIVSRRWFGSKSRRTAGIEVVDAIPVTASARILLLRIGFDTGPDEIYQVPLSHLAGKSASEQVPTPWIRVQSRDGAESGVLYEALDDPAFCARLLEMFETPGTIAESHGELVVQPTPAFDAERGDRGETLLPKGVAAEQSNSSIIFGRRMIMKIFRRLEAGINPDFEISDFLTRHGFAGTPAMAGSLIYRQTGGEPLSLALLQGFVPNRGDAWKFTLDWLDAALAPLAKAEPLDIPPEPEENLVRASELPIPLVVRSAFEEFLTRVERLGRRTAEMHLALASDPALVDFAPQAFSAKDRRQFYGSASQYAGETFALLREQLPELNVDVAEQAGKVLDLAQSALDQYAALATPGDAGESSLDKIRIHGDYHLGQVLATDDDFMIIDFEGEPVRSIEERRQKQLALRDVAGMIRSLHYASRAAATAAQHKGAGRQAVDAWTRAWYAWSAAAFLAEYRRVAGAASFLPRSSPEFAALLTGCLLEKAIYELRYELNNRPNWVYLPLAALVDLLDV